MSISYMEVPIDVATQPKDGHVYARRWWQIKGDNIQFYGSSKSLNKFNEENHQFYPQCNSSKGVAERLLKDDCQLMFLETVYEQSCKNYIRKQQ